jgi:predicted regulator of Ras-like GTPase activity (Roadblock/LC7/MglB family)
VLLQIGTLSAVRVGPEDRFSGRGAREPVRATADVARPPGREGANGPMNRQLVLYDEEFRRIVAVCERLVAEAHARAVFLVDRAGQLLASAGQTEHLDTTSLASLTAGNIAATGGLAQLIGEPEFTILFHQGQRDHLHLSLVGRRAILVVLFDARSTLGIVRLRVKQASEELARILEGRAGAPEGPSPFAEITDEDIDNLFRE